MGIESCTCPCGEVNLQKYKHPSPVVTDEVSHNAYFLYKNSILYLKHFCLK